MPVPSEKIARQDSILAELSELAIGVARDMAGKVAEAGSAQEAAAAASGFHKVARAVRQTIALEMKLERDRKALEREDSKHAAGERQARVARRRLRLRTAVGRMAWSEVETDEAENLCDHLDDLLAEDALEEGFADVPFEDQVARLRVDLGLPPLPPEEDEGEDREPAGAAPDIPHLSAGAASGVPPPASCIEQPPSAAELRAASG
ncbi:MAG TPA: hypothetical protein VGC92_03360 [Phenylobacterium sp.]|jgi:hypothetical protein